MIAVLLSVGVALSAGVATAADWYVSNTQGAWESGAEKEKYDGTSATVSGLHGPFFKIQSAIDAATADDTVHVAAGTYGDEQGYQEAAVFENSRSRIWINKAITVKGASRDTTIIRGAHDPAGGAVNGLGAAAVRCVAIASASGAALPGSRLESFTLTGGATQNNETDGMGTRGGGVLVPQKSDDRNYIVDCLIKDNAATRGGGGFGGVYVNCIFDGNRADKGAGGRNGGAARTCSMLGCIVVNSRAGSGAVDFINRMVNCTVYGNSQVLRPVGTEPFSQNAGCFVRNSVVLGNDSTGSSIKPNPNVVPDGLDGGNNVARNYDPADTKGDLVAAAFGDYRPVAGGDVADAGDAAALVAFQEETGIPDDLRNYDLFGQPRVRADGKVAAGAVATPIVPQGGALKSRFGASDAVLFNGVQLKAGEAVWADVWPKQVYLTRTGLDSASGLVCYAVAESNTLATADAVQSSYHFPDRADGYWLTYPAAEEPNLQTGLTNPKNAVHNPNVVFLVSSIVGIVRYVNGASTSETEDGSAERPYKTIQAAVAAGTNNKAVRIQVAPGVYGGTQAAATQTKFDAGFDADKNPITVDGGLSTVWIPSGNSLFLRSDDGAEQTVIRGVWANTETGIGDGAVRCVAVTASGRPVGLSGFTLENGATLVSTNAHAGWGGGFCSVRTASSALAPNHQLIDSIVRNCTAGRGPGAFGGWYRRVLFTNNVERGGNHYLREAVLSGCVIGPNPGNTAQLLGQNVYCLNSTFVVDPTSRGGFLGGEDKAENVAVGVNCLFFGGKDCAAFRRAAFVGNFWDGATQTQTVGNVTYTTVRVADFANGDYRPLAGEPVVGGGSSAYKFYGRHAGTDFDNNPVVGSSPTVDANGKVVLTSGAFVKPVSAVVVSAVDGVVATPGGTNVVAVGETTTVTVEKGTTCARNLLGLVVDGEEKSGVFSWTFTGTDPATRVLLEPLFATDWYADAVHGDDARDGWTPETAKRTLAAAMAAVVPGDTVHAAEGDYDEGTAILATSSSGAGSWRVVVPSRVVVPTGVSLVASGARDRTRIVGRAADQADPPQVRSNGEVVKKTNLGASFEADWQAYGVGTNGSVKCVTLQPNARIRGFTLTGGRTGCPEDVTADYTLGAAVLGYDAETSIVEDCLITNNVSGRAVVYNATAINCDIRDNAALWNGGFGRKARFVGSRLRGNVSPYLAAEACYGFYNCTIDGNWCDGAKTRPLTGLVANSPSADVRFQLVNTIVMGFDKATTYRNSNVYGDVLNCVLEEGFERGTSFTATNRFEKVRFAARGAVLRENGRTRTSSVAVGAGDPGLWLAAWGDRDLYGNARFLDGTIDIGPEQYDPARRKGFLLLIR